MLASAGGDRVGERNDPFSLVDDGIVDKYPVDGDGRRPGPLCLGESVNYLASAEHLIRVGPVDAIDHGYLVWVDADPPPMTQRPRDNAVLFEERLVADLQEWSVKGRGQAGSAGVVDDFRPTIGKRTAKIAQYRGQAEIAAEVTGTENQRDQPRSACRDLCSGTDAGASLDQRDHAHMAVGETVLLLGLGDEPVKAAHVGCGLDLGEKKHVYVLTNNGLDVPGCEPG